MAGTANDYIGTLSTTRSGRTCVKWSNVSDFEQMQKLKISEITFPSTTLRAFASAKSRWKSHLKQDILSMSQSFMKQALPNLSSEFIIGEPVQFADRAYLNDSFFPEQNIQDANNYCRDPSRNIAGTWCYTTDPLVPQDLCDVRDCEKPGKVLIIVVKDKVI